jgi:sugar-specific transcriptional regulator TrmB
MSKPFNYELLGLDARDIRVYEALLGHQETASVRNVAEWTGINRGVVFDSMKKLTELGLLGSNQRGKQKRYFANDPSIFKTLTRHKQDQLEREQHLINAYIETLNSRGKTAVPTQFAAMYEGEEEIAALLRDVLTTVSKLPAKEYCIISATEVRGYLYKKFTNFTRQRVMFGLKVRALSTGAPGEEAPLSERKTLPANGLRVPACYVIIYGDKVAQISLHENLVPYGIVINNKELADVQQLLFDTIWAQV